MNVHLGVVSAGFLFIKLAIMNVTDALESCGYTNNKAWEGNSELRTVRAERGRGKRNGKHRHMYESRHYYEYKF